MNRGDCEGQQVFEALAILVAVRAWLPTCQHRVQLTIRSDNVGALTLAVNMRPKTSRLAVIARELALAFMQISFLPAVVHTPGIAHIIADNLSRLHDPGKPDAAKVLTHSALKNATKTEVPVRGLDFYRTIDSSDSSLHILEITESQSLSSLSHSFVAAVPYSY